MKAIVVIGANYGDEGKGLMTDYFTHKYGATHVVRFNGGAQAGHTVCTPDGKRHVFSHFSSGTFAGADTVLSEDFIVNPVLFRKEYEILEEMGYFPRVYVDPKCLITTPYDMMFNQCVEEARGKDRHGSCGVGINATIDRSDALSYRVEQNERGLQRCYLDHIVSYYRDRFIKLNEFIDSPKVRVQFLEDLEFFYDHIRIGIPWEELDGHCIFEGAQGLGLDQYMGTYPYATRSNTGLRNVIKLQRKHKFEIEEVCYVTRSYMTRHGAGPLENEDPDMKYEDKTNMPNLWQGTLRFGELNGLFDRIKLDIQCNNYIGRKSIAVTHLDQYEAYTDDMRYLVYGETRESVKDAKGYLTFF